MLIINIGVHTKSDYRVILKLASKYCDRAYMVVRPDIESSEALEKFLESIQKKAIESAEESSWPGTTLLGGCASVKHYAVDSKLIEHLGQVANGFFDWMQPQLPEDLGFLKGNKEWLINTAHEKDLHICVEDHEREDVLKALEKQGIAYTSWEWGSFKLGVDTQQ